MKNLLFSILVLATSLSASAQVEFLPSSKIPAGLKKLITETIQSECSQSLYGLKEVSTVVRGTVVDQGRTDFRFSTWIQATHNFDGAHPVTEEILVDSVQYSHNRSNVSQFDVLSVKAYSAGICR